MFRLQSQLAWNMSSHNVKYKLRKLLKPVKTSLIKLLYIKCAPLSMCNGDWRTHLFNIFNHIINYFLQLQKPERHPISWTSAVETAKRFSSSLLSLSSINKICTSPQVDKLFLSVAYPFNDVRENYFRIIYRRHWH